MNVFIIEDEPMAAKRLAKMLEDCDEEINICNVSESVEDAVMFLNSQARIDLIFMDVQLADGISFEIFDLVSVKTPVVFTTAYDEYALEAIRVHAFDYLLKPIKKIDLINVVERFHAKTLSQHKEVNQLSHPQKSYKVLVKLGQNLKVLKLDEASFYYSENKITFFMDRNGKRYPLDLSLDKLEQRLNDKDFFRVNRQFIVNEKCIQNMVTYSVNRIKLTLEPQAHVDVIVSKDKVSRFRKWLVE